MAMNREQKRATAKKQSKVSKLPKGISLKDKSFNIEIEATGETMKLDFQDEGFYAKFFDMFDNYSNLEARFQEEFKRVSALEYGFRRMKEEAKLNYEISKYVAEQIDICFGAGTCLNVFNREAPSIDLVAEFFEQLVPFFEAGMSERQETLSKYNVTERDN